MTLGKIKINMENKIDLIDRMHIIYSNYNTKNLNSNSFILFFVRL
jgi:hypothetical protein